MTIVSHLTVRRHVIANVGKRQGWSSQRAPCRLTLGNTYSRVLDYGKTPGRFAGRRRNDAKNHPEAWINLRSRRLGF